MTNPVKMTSVSLLLVALCAAVLFCGCSMMLLTDDYAHIAVAGSHRVLLIVEEDLYAALSASIDRYVRDAGAQNHEVIVQVWRGGTAAELRAALGAYVSGEGISGAFLVGELPAGWFEMTAHGRYEQFPCDVYMMDLDASWSDADGNGIMDGHTPLATDIFVSRVSGNPYELSSYFDKLHVYNNGGFPVDERAYIFKDDDWSDYERGSTFDLERLFDLLTIHEDRSVTRKSSYLSTLTQGGAAYVYQWIHASPSTLCIAEGDSYAYVGTSDIRAANPRGVFYNLFNCGASRFTENNLAMTYLMQTDFGLATMGSTKIGGNYYPAAFHSILSRGGTWGEAHQVWYDSFGRTDDAWFLGMVVLGDPLLAVTPEARRGLRALSVSLLPPDDETVDELYRRMVEFEDAHPSQGFDEYRTDNPGFF